MNSKRNTQNGSSLVGAGLAAINEAREAAQEILPVPEIEASQSDAQESDVSDVGIDYSQFVPEDDYTPAQSASVALAMSDAGLQQAYRVYETRHNVSWELSRNFSDTPEFNASFFTLVWGMNERINAANEDLPENKRKDTLSQNAREYTFVRVVTELHAHRGAKNAYRISTYAVHFSGSFFKLPARVMQTHDVVMLENPETAKNGTFGNVYAQSLVNGIVRDAMWVSSDGTERGKGYIPAYVKVSAIAARKAYALVASGQATWGKNPLARFIDIPAMTKQERTAF